MTWGERFVGGLLLAFIFGTAFGPAGVVAAGVTAVAIEHRWGAT